MDYHARMDYHAAKQWAAEARGAGYFYPTRARIGRALAHFDDLARVLDEYLSPSPPVPYVAAAERLPQGGIAMRLTHVEPPSAIVSILIGEALHGLRCSLDYAVGALVMKAGNQITSDHAFPIYKTEQGFDSQVDRRLHGVAKAAKQIIKSAEPWESGHNRLWELGQLNNIEKHRTLLATLARPEVNLGRFTSSVPRDTPIVDAFFFQTDNACVKVGDVLYRDEGPGAYDRHKSLPPGEDFRFRVAIHEPTVVDCVPVHEFLDAALDDVTNVIVQLEALA